MNLLHPLFALLLPLGAATHGPSGPDYRIEQTAEPEILRVRFSPQGEPPFTLQPARTLPGAPPADAPAPICLSDRQPVPFNQPFSCRELEWRITLNAAPVAGADASAQQSLLFRPNQWLLTEWGNFPRQPGTTGGRVCLPNGECHPLPALTQPPLILPFGLPGVPVATKAPRLRLHHDEQASQLDLPMLQQQLEAIIDYLAFQLDVSPPAHPWQLVWLGRELSTRSLGGAAGDQVFVANYPLSAGKPTREAPLRLLRTSAHEAVHILNAHPATRQPTWVAESLAEYLAIKALRRFRLHDLSAVEELAQRGSRLPHHSSGLYQAAREVMAGDRAYYPLFYVKGSAFWEALDQALQQRDHTLTHLLPQLGWMADGRFDAPSQARLASAIGSERWQRLSHDYLDSGG